MNTLVNPLEEVWRVIPEYEGFYKASNTGKILGLNYRNNGTSKQLCLIPNKQGYLRVRLQINKKSKTYMVHRLIAYTFLPKKDIENMQINHKNAIKSDNRVENLEWVTPKDNMRHAVANNLMPKFNRIGIGLGRSNLKARKAVECFNKNNEIVSVYDSITIAANQLKLTASKISSVC